MYRKTLHLLRLRMLPFSFMPQLNDPVSQGYGYLADVITSDDGSQKRRLLREIPHGWLEFTVTGIGAADPRLVSALLHGWTHRPFGVPVWPWWNRLRTAIVPGATEIDVDATDGPWAAGMVAVLWRGAGTGGGGPGRRSSPAGPRPPPPGPTPRGRSGGWLSSGGPPTRGPSPASTRSSQAG